MTGRSTVLVIESNQMYADLIGNALHRIRYRFKIVAYAWSTAELLAELAKHRPQVVVISCDLKDGPMTGIRMLPTIRKSYPEIRILLLLPSSDRGSVVDAFRFGAVGVFSKTSPFEHLGKAVEVVSQGQIWASTAELHYVLNAFRQSPRHPTLSGTIMSQITRREAAVVRLAVEGLSNREIGRELTLTEHTVKNYLFRVFDKLGVSNRVELVLSCLHHDEVDRQRTTEASGVLHNAISNRLTNTA